MNDFISRQALCEYALNQKDKSITPNDIMRFPSAQSDVSDINVGDTIYRQAAIKAFDDAGFCTHGYIVDVLEGLPSAQSERKKGRWMPVSDETYTWHYCSECHYQQYEKTKFCSNCGADMRGE